MFCALLGHTGERLQDHWSSGLIYGSIKTISVESEILLPFHNFFFSSPEPLGSLTRCPSAVAC